MSHLFKYLQKLNLTLVTKHSETVVMAREGIFSFCAVANRIRDKGPFLSEETYSL